MKSSIKLSQSARWLSRGVAAAFCLATCVAVADDQSPSAKQGSGAKQLQQGDAGSFIKETLQANQAEIALAEVAQRKAQSPQVKEFAAMMRRDHQQASQQLQPLARQHGIAIAQTIDAKHQQKLQELQQLSGSEFDKEYMTHMLKDHQKEISKCEKAVEQIQDPQVKQFAQNMIPKLRQHLQHARQTAQAVGVDQSTISSIVKDSPDALGGTGDEPELETGQGAAAEKHQQNQNSGSQENQSPGSTP